MFHLTFATHLLQVLYYYLYLQLVLQGEFFEYNNSLNINIVYCTVYKIKYFNIFLCFYSIILRIFQVLIRKFFQKVTEKIGKSRENFFFFFANNLAIYTYEIVIYLIKELI